jgi:hypothetical protein
MCGTIVAWSTEPWWEPEHGDDGRHGTEGARRSRRPARSLAGDPRGPVPRPRRVGGGLSSRRGAPLRAGGGAGAAGCRRRERGGAGDRRRAPVRLRRLAASPGRTHRAPLRPPRRDAARARGKVGLARLRAHRARRSALRARHGRRQGRRAGPRGRRGLLSPRRGDPAAQREVHRRGRGGDRLPEPEHFPPAVPGPDGGGLHRPHRYEELRRGTPRADVSAPRSLSGGRGGAGPSSAAALGLQRARARPGAGPLRDDRRPPQAERRPQHPRPLRQGGPAGRQAARAHPQAPAVGGQVQEGRRHAAGRAALGRDAALPARAPVDATRPHRDRAGGAPVPRRDQPDHRGGARGSRSAPCPAWTRARRAG